MAVAQWRSHRVPEASLAVLCRECQGGGEQGVPRGVSRECPTMECRTLASARNGITPRW